MVHLRTTKGLAGPAPARFGAAGRGLALQVWVGHGSQWLTTNNECWFRPGAVRHGVALHGGARCGKGANGTKESQ
jgi:hypothetical protein